MNKKVLITVILLTFICLSACSMQENTQDNTMKEETTTEEDTGIPQEALDNSEMRTDISNILSDDVTEARILSWGLTYRTTDKEEIEEIKNRLSQMELTETEPKTIDESNPRTGGQVLTLYLLQDDKILYQFHTDNRYDIFTVCGKHYNSEEANFDSVLAYCRQKFFDGP